MNDFITLFTLAKAGDAAAVEVILNMYRPLLYKESMQQGVFNEDLLSGVMPGALELYLQCNLPSGSLDNWRGLRSASPQPFIRSVQSLFATKGIWVYPADTE